ncbi:phosphoethanolamine transferase [Vibrio splendidus]
MKTWILRLNSVHQWRDSVPWLSTTKPISMPVLIGLLALYFGFGLNLPVVSQLVEQARATGVPIAGYASPLVLTLAFYLIFSLLAIPYLYRPIFSVLILSSSAAWYATTQYMVIFDYSMIENIFETHSSEAAAYINSNSVFWFTLTGVLPTVWLWLVRVDHQPHWSSRLMRRGIGFSVAAFGLVLLAAMFYKDYAAIGRNNSHLNKWIVPTHVYYTVKYLNRTYFTEPLPFTTLGEDATLIEAANGKPNLIVLVVGETARAQNFRYNGYERDTNPYTADRDLIALQNVSSCGTSTAHSLPCMFSDLTRKQYNRREAVHRSNALDILVTAGYHVQWIENDGGDKGIAKRVPLDTLSVDESHPHCDGSYCHDEALLSDMESHIKDSATALVLHTIGSHGPTYYQRYPSSMARFTPACERSDIQNCSDEEIVNVYDNTIVYTDYFLNLLIERLQPFQATHNVKLMYISDHGESLGESGLYLHGTPYAFAPKEQTHIPWLMWFGEGAAEQNQWTDSCLQQQATTGNWSHDHFFHSLLDFASVKTQVLESDMSFFKNCQS